MNMNMQRLFGVVLLLVGICLLIVGVNASHSVADQVSNSITGKFTQETAWYIFGGGAAALFGLLLALSSFRGSKA
jgi:uncharacterized protein DUF3185